MIHNIDNNNKIKENKYKILRMSLLLGNGEDREDTIRNFEDAAHEIDAMNDQIYLKDLESKIYDTLTLEEEEKKLTVLVDYIGGRLEQRMSLLEDFNNVTGYELMNLPPIKYQDRLEEYKNRLFYIKEYLDNNKNIEDYNKEIDSLENKLNNSYVNKAKAEERNKQSEEELLNKFNTIIRKNEELKDINLENAEIKLSDIKALVEDSKKSLDIFNKSFATLNEAGISGEEREEYQSYVNSAREAYYKNKEIEFLLYLYIIINRKENEYNKILAKRDSINDIVYERSKIRKELNVKNEDILSNLYPSLDRQYDDISKQKDNIDSIEYLISEINNKKELISDLEKDNQKVEILSLLKEFCLIDTYDDKSIETSNIDDIDNKNDNENDKENENKEETTEEEIPSFADNKIVEENVETPEKNDDLTTNESKNTISFDNDSKPIESETEDNNFEIPEETNEISTEDKNNEEDIDYNNFEDNEVVSVKETSKINVEEAVKKSNNVMKRVGEMLGVKAEPEETTKEEPETSQVQEVPLPEVPEETPEVPEETTKEEPEPVEEIIQPNNTEDKNNEENTVETPSVEETPSKIELNDNIFMNDNFDADPENNADFNIPTTNSIPQENPLFNNEFANKTIDDVMADNKNIENNIDNDFWFSQEEKPLDLNSLPDINNNQNNNIFFGNNETIPDLNFPSLGGQPTTEKEEQNEN